MQRVRVLELIDQQGVVALAKHASRLLVVPQKVPYAQDKVVKRRHALAAAALRVFLRKAND